ncbi:MAG: hypothetical protein AAFY58_00400 [Planctomycetota bacterium]
MPSGDTAQADAAQDERLAIDLDPPAKQWPSIIGASESSFSPTDLQRTTRAELGLVVDKPVILSGHQTEFWHAGILAKHLAGQQLATRHGAHLAWLAVDQDAPAALPIRYPSLQDGVLTEARWGPNLPADVPTGMLDPIRDWPDVPIDAATPEIAASFAELREALGRHTDAPSLAEQIEHARSELLGLDGMTVSAAAFARTTLFDRIVAAMREDPSACVSAYNAAVRAHPEGRLRELDAEPGREELPLWHVAPGAPRVGVRADQLSALDAGQLAPKALLMTGIARLALCDVFIHGLGGRDYDPAMQAWLDGWLLPTMPGEALAPAVIATATVRVPLDVPEPPTKDQVKAAAALARRAKDDPAAVGDGERAAEKQRLVNAMRDAKEQKDKAASDELFKAMKALAAEHQSANADAIRALAEEADCLTKAHAGRDLAHDRTWPAVFLGDAVLGELRSAIAQAFDAE